MFGDPYIVPVLATLRVSTSRAWAAHIPVKPPVTVCARALADTSSSIQIPGLFVVPTLPMSGPNRNICCRRMRYVSAANTCFTYVSRSPAERLIETYSVGCPATPRYDTHGQHCVGRLGMEHHLPYISGITHISRRSTRQSFYFIYRIVSGTRYRIVSGTRYLEFVSAIYLQGLKPTTSL